MIKIYDGYLFRGSNNKSICGRRTITVDEFTKTKYFRLQEGMQFSTVMPSGLGIISSTLVMVYWDLNYKKYMCDMLTSVGSWRFNVPVYSMDSAAHVDVEINHRNIPLVAGYVLYDKDQNSTVKFKPWNAFEKSVQVPMDKIRMSTQAEKNGRMILSTNSINLNSKGTYYTMGDVFQPTIVVDSSMGAVVSDAFLGAKVEFTHPDGYIVDLNDSSATSPKRIICITADMEYDQINNKIIISNDDFSNITIVASDGSYIIQ